MKVVFNVLFLYQQWKVSLPYYETRQQFELTKDLKSQWGDVLPSSSHLGSLYLLWYPNLCMSETKTNQNGKKSHRIM